MHQPSGPGRSRWGPSHLVPSRLGPSCIGPTRLGPSCLVPSRLVRSCIGPTGLVGPSCPGPSRLWGSWCFRWSLGEEAYVSAGPRCEEDGASAGLFVRELISSLLPCVNVLMFPLVYVWRSWSLSWSPVWEIRCFCIPRCEEDSASAGLFVRELISSLVPCVRALTFPLVYVWGSWCFRWSPVWRSRWFRWSPM